MENSKVSPIDQYVIDQVRKIRIQKGVSQARIALELEKTSGFIGNIENPNLNHKYNLVQLNIIAKLLECSIKDFLPDAPL
jgi:transcriptional regulator with XRE-family HTH domain